MINVVDHGQRCTFDAQIKLIMMHKIATTLLSNQRLDIFQRASKTENVQQSALLAPLTNVCASTQLMQGH